MLRKKFANAIHVKAVHRVAKLAFEFLLALRRFPVVLCEGIRQDGESSPRHENRTLPAGA